MRRIPPGSMYYMCLTASIETRNPNAVLIGTKFGFLNYGGRYKTRKAKSYSICAKIKLNCVILYWNLQILLHCF